MNQTLIRLLFFFFLVNSASANNMLVQNVTTTGNNAVNKTIQVQFDISWDNSWRDSINWDAAWIFMKFKDANGLWQHCKLNQTGFANGTGTASTLQVTSDKVGSWLYRSALGSGTFNSTGMQLQWNYGLSGLTNVTGLEVRVFAVEMVYVPEGDFTLWYYNYDYYCGSNLPTLNGGYPVINTRLTPNLQYNFDTVRIKGDAGIDTNHDGTIDVTTYPMGYSPFYTFRYSLSEQQYADFLNTLTQVQVSNLGVAGQNIGLFGNQYFSSTPNLACSGFSQNRFFSYADWCGMRPVSALEINKAIYGPFSPDSYFYNGPYYGVLYYNFAITIDFGYYSYTESNGNGSLDNFGYTDINSWLSYSSCNFDLVNDKVIIYCRSAE